MTKTASVIRRFWRISKYSRRACRVPTGKKHKMRRIMNRRMMACRISLFLKKRTRVNYISSLKMEDTMKNKPPAMVYVKLMTS